MVGEKAVEGVLDAVGVSGFDHGAGDVGASDGGASVVSGDVGDAVEVELDAELSESVEGFAGAVDALLAVTGEGGLEVVESGVLGGACAGEVGEDVDFADGIVVRAEFDAGDQGEVEGLGGVEGVGDAVEGVVVGEGEELGAVACGATHDPLGVVDAVGTVAVGVEVDARHGRRGV